MAIIESIFDTARSLPLTQWVAFITGVIYVVLAARERVSCWIFGIISCAFIAWDDFTRYLLYADGVLQIFYIGIGILGLYRWRYGGEGQTHLPVTERSPLWHLALLVIGVTFTIPAGWALNRFSTAEFAFADSLTTIFSLIATYLLVQKVRSTWLYWIVIDAIYVYLFWMREGYLIALLYMIFCIVAIYGYRNWGRKLMTS